MKTFLLERALPVLERVSDVLAALAMALILALIGAMLYESVSRYVFNAPTLWSFDVSYMTNGSIFLIGAAYTLKRNGHVRIDFLSTRLPVRVQHGVNLAFYLLIFLPMLLITAQACVDKAWTAYVRGTVENMSVWQPLLWPFLTAIATGVVGLTLQVLVESVRHAIGIGDPSAVKRPSETAGARA
ncbi:MAG: TRAP transporter small permease subunit [Guyparkeria sp.]